MREVWVCLHRARSLPSRRSDSQSVRCCPQCLAIAAPGTFCHSSARRIARGRMHVRLLAAGAAARHLTGPEASELVRCGQVWIYAAARWLRSSSRGGVLGCSTGCAEVIRIAPRGTGTLLWVRLHAPVNPAHAPARRTGRSGAVGGTPQNSVRRCRGQERTRPYQVIQCGLAASREGLCTIDGISVEPVAAASGTGGSSLTTDGIDSVGKEDGCRRSRRAVMAARRSR
jgi:hypothetical protein